LGQPTSTTVHRSLSAAEADDARASLIQSFDPARIDAQAQAEILRALESAAERQRALAPEEDPDVPYLSVAELNGMCAGELEIAPGEDYVPYKDGELPWQGMGEGGQNAHTERLLAEMEARKALPEEERARLQREDDEMLAAAEARAEANRLLSARIQPMPGMDPLDWRNWSDEG
jgi:hypothetical protein